MILEIVVIRYYCLASLIQIILILKMSVVLIKRFFLKNLTIFGILCLLFVWTNGEKARFERLEYRFDRTLTNITGGVDSKGVMNLDYELFKRVDSLYVNFELHTKF